MPGLDVSSLEPTEHSRLIKSLVTPRPIGWISTRDENGIDNLAPYSCFNYVNRSPPAVMFRSGIGEEGELKDSPRNTLDTGEFVVNVVTERVAERMDQTSASLPADESEFAYAGLDRGECVHVSAPRVEDAAANLECRLHDSFEVFDSILVVGEVVYVHLSDDLLRDGEIDMRNIDSVGRLGGPYYTSVQFMDLERGY